MNLKISTLLFLIVFGLASCGFKSYSEENITPKGLFYKTDNSRKCFYSKDQVKEPDIMIQSFSITENELDKSFIYKNYNNMRPLFLNNCINIEESLNFEKKMKKGENYYFSIQTNYTNISFFQCFEFYGVTLIQCS